MSKLSQAWRGFLEHRFVRGAALPALNEWQQAFCRWNAERLGIGVPESTERFQQSWAALKKGHGGRHFKLYCELNHDLMRPFAGNRENEIFAAYQAHAPLHFLRMLSYRVPTWPGHIPELQPFFDASNPVICDFGCGLAQASISLARFLRDRRPHLVLIDIPVPQLEFLRWFCRDLKLNAAFAECTPAAPLPDFSACDVLIATELFEHLHDPLPYLKTFASRIKPGGFLVTNIADHDPEFLHVTPKLAPLRHYLRENSWKELRLNRIFRKPPCPSVAAEFTRR
jgi:SAM-dependent methyltransferase